MTDTEVKLVIGALLHDVGKVIYRQGDDRRKHSRSGYDFLREETPIEDKEILDAVLYHHADYLKGSDLPEDSLAYIVYIADNIASAADRRVNDSEQTGFEVSMPLQSVFNILNGNQQSMYYRPQMLGEAEKVNYPVLEPTKFDEPFYQKVKENLRENLRGLTCDQEYVNSLLEVMEANLSYVPSSTNRGELADISLYDHVKLTAALSSCIYAWLEEQKNHDYRTALFKNAKTFYEEEAFLLYSMDVSGIQDFIYTIVSENALKTLRARSFYLEIMMEHIIDCLLQRLHLSRANLIYSGGGHCYLLLPNTEACKTELRNYNETLNQWLLDQFQISLYVADGYAPCSACHLQNVPDGSYAAIFHTVSERLSAQKSHRYSAETIIRLNESEPEDYTRECKVCKRIARVNENGICPVCSAIEKFSGKILFENFFTVLLAAEKDALPLPGGYYLVADDRESLTDRMQNDQNYVRTYGKNRMFTGRHIATKLWVGDYSMGKDTATFAKEADGIDRIAVLRADVDNLGHAFVAGFENKDHQNRYVTLSRTATLSRQLSLFFKYHINQILADPVYTIDGKKKEQRNVTICYSGGDDVFLIGAWNEVFEAAVDLRNRFSEYTQGTLTLSAGIGLYQPGYPISAAAREVAELESASKHRPGKDAITVFPDGRTHIEKDGQNKVFHINDGTYGWDTFSRKVIGEKYKLLQEFFAISDDRGKNFMYHLLELLRSREEKIQFARYVYILARLEPDQEAPEIQQQNYRKFSEKMYRWYQEEEDSIQLRTAMQLYAYLTREEE